MADVGEYDVKFMRRALELASKAGGNTRPNPLVGAVIVNKGEIIGEGFHSKAGEPHAEVVAFNRVSDRSLISGSDIYVTLEPCSHWGRTPPCAEMIAREGFRRVIIGATDTSTKVSGRGIEILQRAGCKVVTSVLEDECRRINRRFFTFHEKQRPYILLKWARTADGFFDAERHRGAAAGPNWITGSEERLLVHKWRSEEQAVMIGENTLCNDDPSLDVRYWSGLNPVRIVVSDSDNLSDQYRLFRDNGITLVYTTHPAQSKENVEFVGISSRESAIDEILASLHERGLQSVMVEGGAYLLGQFIERALWDEARIFTGYKEFGKGLPAPLIDGEKVESQQFETSILDIYIPVDD